MQKWNDPTSFILEMSMITNFHLGDGIHFRFLRFSSNLALISFSLSKNTDRLKLIKLIEMNLLWRSVRLAHLESDFQVN